MVPSPPTAMTLRAEVSRESVCCSRRAASVSSAFHSSRLNPKDSMISGSWLKTRLPIPPPEMGLIRNAMESRASVGIEPPGNPQQDEILQAREVLPRRDAGGGPVVADHQAAGLEAHGLGDVERTGKMVVLAHDEDAADAGAPAEVQQGNIGGTPLLVDYDVLQGNFLAAREVEHGRGFGIAAPNGVAPQDQPHPLAQHHVLHSPFQA